MDSESHAYPRAGVGGQEECNIFLVFYVVYQPECVLMGLNFGPIDYDGPIDLMVGPIQ